MDPEPGSSRQGHSTSKPPKKPRVVPLLKAITPDNVEEEKLKFFSNNYTYNPQFTYCTPPRVNVLQRYGKASERLLKAVG